MQLVKHKALSRGYANHGWVESFHSFSFAGYHHPNRMNFGALRVLNDDVVQPKMGFAAHQHQHMEIISIPLKGALTHKDSMNHKKAIEVGEVQVMSAGTGITHSEFNDSPTDEVHFLQLWIIPEHKNVTPSYAQKRFDLHKRDHAFQTLVSPNNALVSDSLGIHQQGYIHIGNFSKNSVVHHGVKPGNGSYIFLLQGEVEVCGEWLYKRDALGVWDTDKLHIKVNKDSEILIIDVPMY